MVILFVLLIVKTNVIMHVVWCSIVNYMQMMVLTTIDVDDMWFASLHKKLKYARDYCGVGFYTMCIMVNYRVVFRA